MSTTVRERTRHVLAAILRVPDAALGDAAAMDSTPNWDSLAQLDILAACEQEFGLAIEPDQAVDLVTFEALAAFMERHASRR